MSIKIITPPAAVYTPIPDTKDIYRKGDPKCQWCDTNKGLSRNETYGTYCCESCKND